VLASGGTNYTAIGVLLAIFVPICAAIALIVGWYFRLQRHRADAVAMAAYRKLAEEAVANQAELRDQLAAVIHGCAGVERSRLRSVFDEPVGHRYREPDPLVPQTAPGLIARARAYWKDPGHLARARLPGRPVRPAGDPGVRGARGLDHAGGPGSPCRCGTGHRSATSRTA